MPDPLRDRLLRALEHNGIDRLSPYLLGRLVEDLERAAQSKPRHDVDGLLAQVANLEAENTRLIDAAADAQLDAEGRRHERDDLAAENKLLLAVEATGRAVVESQGIPWSPTAQRFIDALAAVRAYRAATTEESNG